MDRICFKYAEHLVVRVVVAADTSIVKHELLQQEEVDELVGTST